MADTERLTPQDKDVLLARISAAWAGLEAVVDRFDDARLSVPPAGGGWSACDHLAHVAAWLDVLPGRIEGLPDHIAFGVDPESTRTGGIDRLNAELYRRAAGRPPAEVLAWLRQAHARVVAAIEPLTAADLARPTWPDDPRRRPLIDVIVGNTYEHYREHLDALRALAHR